MRNSKKLIALVLALSMLLIGLVLVVREAIIRPAADGTVDEGEQPQGQELDDVEEAGSPGEGTDEDESTGRIPVDENGFDADGRIVAYFGTPDRIDGEIEDIWNIAEPVRFTKMPMGKTNTTATMRVLWDDRAVYFLVEVKDENLSDASVNVYEKDSVEFFLDEDNRRSGIYEGDDSQFRINFKNERSADHGDLTNLYSAAKVVEGGYVVEGRVALLYPPANGKVMGVEAQVNDAVGSTRIATLNIFDSTGTAYM
ncbi:MAG: sugar-binding protein, partial [Acetivibrionales bacterium]